MALLATRYASRSLRRNSRRTILSVLGIAVGCALALISDSFNRGKDAIFLDAVVETGVGHLRVVPSGWSRTRKLELRLRQPEAALAAARAQAGVAAAAPRARAQALLAMGSRSVGVEMVGVDPAAEPQVYRLLRRLSEGSYLVAGERGAAVLGGAVAERLRVGLGDDLVASAVGPGGQINSLMVRVQGIVRTGSEEADASICHVVLADLEELTGLAGPAEIALAIAEPRRAAQVRDALAPRLPAGDEALTWGEITPEMSAHLEQDSATSRLVTAIIVLVVLLGVASAQLAAVLERRREFAILAAVGLRPARMMRLVLGEALALGLVGGALGLLLALPPVAWLSVRGLDLSSLVGKQWVVSGIAFEPVLHGDLGGWLVIEAFGLALCATLLASLYPAWFASRTDPATALRVAQ